jgi:hypothetical protein
VSPEPAGNGRRIWFLLPAVSLAGSLLLLLHLPWPAILLQAASAWWILMIDLRAGRPERGAVRMLVWAWTTSLWTILLTVLFPQAASGILHGPAYREEMLTWIRTGVGAESHPAQFLPQHILHYGLTLAASLASAGLGGLVLGCFLLGYMNYYVGELIRVSARPAIPILAGWPIWSMFRVAAFVFGAVGAAVVLPGRILRRIPWPARSVQRLFLWRLLCFAADLLLKALLAPVWRRWLERALLP